MRRIDAVYWLERVDLVQQVERVCSARCTWSSSRNIVHTVLAEVRSAILRDCCRCRRPADDASPGPTPATTARWLDCVADDAETGRRCRRRRRRGFCSVLTARRWYLAAEVLAVTAAGPSSWQLSGITSTTGGANTWTALTAAHSQPTHNIVRKIAIYRRRKTATVTLVFGLTNE